VRYVSWSYAAGPMMLGRAKKYNLMSGKIETYTNNAKTHKNLRGIKIY